MKVSIFPSWLHVTMQTAITTANALPAFNIRIDCVIVRKGFELLPRAVVPLFVPVISYWLQKQCSHFSETATK